MNIYFSKYHQQYIKLFPNGNLFDKDYTTTIIRNIIIYFMYKHYKEKKISRDELKAIFKMKYVNSLYSKLNFVEIHLDNRNFLLKKKQVFEHFFYIFHKVYINNFTTNMKKLTPINLDCDNNEFLDINVYDLDNGIFLVRDSKENIQFKCTAETLNMDVDKSESFNDQLFFNKIAAQNSSDDDGSFERNDSYYIFRLSEELSRIVSHLEYAYKEFGAKIDKS